MPVADMWIGDSWCLWQGGPRMSSTALEQMRAEILREVEAERQAAWHEALEKDKAGELDHERQGPAPLETPWLNLKDKAAQEDAPKNQEIFACLDRNEVGDAELFARLCGADFRFDHSRGYWLRFGGVLWERDTLGQAQRAVMSTVADTYEKAGEERRVYFTTEAQKVAGQIKRIMDEMAQAKAAGDDGQVAFIGKDLDTARTEHVRLMKKAESARKKSDDRARTLRANRRSLDVLKVSARGDDSLGITGEGLDRHPTLLACRNGVLDLETGRLLKPDRGLYLTMGSQLDFPGLHVRSDWWDDLLQKVFCGDEEMIHYFGQTMAYSVTGLRANKDFFCALGPLADNGKSTVFNAIKEAVGSIATTIRVEVLLEKDKRGNSGPDPDLMVLDGLRLGIASEASNKQKFSVEQIKAITGDDGIRARAMYSDTKLLRSNVKLWLHTNKVPQMSDNDDGFTRRLRLLPFNAQFVRDPAEVDASRHKYQMLPKAVVDKQRAEALPAILSWIARNARIFFKNGLTYETPEIVQQNTDEYFAEQDSVGAFLEGACIVDGSFTELSNSRLYSAFKLWCSEVMCLEERYIMKSKAFSQNIKQRPGLRMKRLRPSIIWSGLRLREEWEDKLDEQEKRGERV